VRPYVQSAVRVRGALALEGDDTAETQPPRREAPQPRDRTCGGEIVAPRYDLAPATTISREEMGLEKRDGWDQLHACRD